MKNLINSYFVKFCVLGGGSGGGGVGSEAYFREIYYTNLLNLNSPGVGGYGDPDPPHLRPPFRSAQSFQYSLKKPKVFD